RLAAVLTIPAVELALRFLAIAAITLLDLPDEHFGMALCLIEVVVRELAPLLSDLTLQLRPLSLQRVTIHVVSNAGGFNRNSQHSVCLSCLRRRLAGAAPRRRLRSPARCLRRFLTSQALLERLHEIADRPNAFFARQLDFFALDLRFDRPA